MRVQTAQERYDNLYQWFFCISNNSLGVKYSSWNLHNLDYIENLCLSRSSEVLLIRHFMYHLLLTIFCSAIFSHLYNLLNFVFLVVFKCIMSSPVCVFFLWTLFMLMWFVYIYLIVLIYCFFTIIHYKSTATFISRCHFLKP